MLRFLVWTLFATIAASAIAQQYDVRKVDDYLYVSQKRMLVLANVQKEIGLAAGNIQALAKAGQGVEKVLAAQAKARQEGRQDNQLTSAGVSARTIAHNEAVRILGTLTPAQESRLTELCVQLDGQNLLLFSYAIRGRLGMDDAQAKSVRVASDEYNQKISQAMRPAPGTPPAKDPVADRKQRAAKAAVLGAQKEKAMLAALTAAQRKIWEAAKGRPLAK